MKSAKHLMAFLPLLALLSYASAAELRSTVGTVEVKKAGAATWTQGRPKTKVEDGDIVRTGIGSETEVRLDEGHKLHVRERSSLKIASGKAPETKLELIVGRVRAFVSKLKGKNKFEIKTPVAVASIRGTVFDLEVGEDQSSRLSVLEGIVSYRDLAGLGAEVQVLKGQSVMVEPGSAPKPPESLPADLQQGLVPDRANQDALFDLKSEVTREAGMSAFKEFFQSDAANEMKVAQYQEGKTVVDAFGKRVRIEEYIVRPDPKEWSFVSLNTREDRFDFTRYDVYAHDTLPEDIGSINLFSKTGTDPMTNWVEKTHRLTSNGNDYYREWQEGGSPIVMTPTTGGQYQQVVFTNWFTEVKGDTTLTLLSHWVPDPAYLNGSNPIVTKPRDDNDYNEHLVHIIPSGYVDFESGSDAGTTVGDTRGINAGFTSAQRLDFFNNATVADSYRASEGYVRTSDALFDGVKYADYKVGGITDAEKLAIFNATAFSRTHTYTVPDGTDITARVDEYDFTDEGTRLSFDNILRLGNNVEGINYQSVFTSSLLGNRKIDVVIRPSLLKKAGLLNN